MSRYQTQTLGYPRIGPRRELKRALSSYWKGDIDDQLLLTTLREVEDHAWGAQLAAGIDRIGVGDSTLYDLVLDWAYRFGIIPRRFHDLDGLDQYFAMARGAEEGTALELTKWFDTNYHYLVPEIEADFTPDLAIENYLETLHRAKESLGERAVPIVLGPVTLLALSKVEAEIAEALEKLLPLYVQLLAKLAAIGIQEVQLHEPALVLDLSEDLRSLFEKAYAPLSESGLDLNLVTYFDDLGASLDWLVELPIDVLSLDFTRGDNLGALREVRWPSSLTLAAGVIDSRNIWRVNTDEVLAVIAELSELVPDLRLSASSSLQFVPYTVEAETGLPNELRDVLAFAQEKLAELAVLARPEDEQQAEVADWASRWQTFRDFAPDRPEVSDRLKNLDGSSFSRDADYESRRQQQIKLPPFPTTTIGSFPQTTEIRRLRAQYKNGDLTEQEYHDKIDSWIAYTIGVQEGLGLDVLVHGEFERSDMVEYFAQKLTGFAFTQHGWVQSYGHRYVRPPIIYADVTRPEPMTTWEFSRAQSFTEKPVKGMLTGPVTILNWSFPRKDIPRKDIAFQLALALRDEIEDLEEAGARVIQVDEPALREGLPFKQERWDAYLEWATDAFRLATGAAEPRTQIHTHMCYAEFGDVLGAIDRLNADVISIENARSDDETLRQLADYGYSREVGPGVYDVHSPVVAEEDAVIDKLQAFNQHLDPHRIWVNPDCGLKTRGWKEVIPSLANLVRAAERMRSEV